jgi:hypothetical protein
MKEYTFTEDVALIAVTAQSFPEGIGEAFNTLMRMLPDSQERVFFGISYPNKERGLIYKAAVSQAFDGESEQYNCETFVLSKGKYLTETVKNWRGQVEKIGLAFRNLGKSRSDIVAPGIEWYQGEDVMCMLKLEA